ncbi:L,D-transpeptidase [Palleronia sp.]|uniref:L,D-transpeptidase family protein n=1 Tax=Palleronia sp. TaxID=1940284 RepID=UPI0035C7C1DA
MTPHDLVLTPAGLRLGGRRIPCTIGRGGITDDKQEGDGATPSGMHRLAGVLYRPDRVAPPVPWAIPIGLQDIWSDDPTDPRYNRMSRGPSPFSHERLRRADPLYDLVILTDWNWPDAVPGRGSAIFLHRWRRPGYPTEGCVAMEPADLAWVAGRLTPDTRLIV